MEAREGTEIRAKQAQIGLSHVATGYEHDRVPVSQGCRTKGTVEGLVLDLVSTAFVFPTRRSWVA